MILLKLILAHLIGDFVLQPNSWVKRKQTYKIKTFAFYAHLLVHAGLLLLFLWDLSMWPLVLSLIILHGIIDILKLYLQKRSTQRRWFLIDQFLHLLSILMVWYLWEESELGFYSVVESTEIWIFATAIIFLTSVSGILIKVLLADWSTAIADTEESSLKSAGRYIGILERLLVFTFVLTGSWEAIGFLLAAKSVFRFGDLKEAKDRKLTEYIMIGTFLSITIAIATGVLVQAFI